MPGGRRCGRMPPGPHRNRSDSGANRSKTVSSRRREGPDARRSTEREFLKQSGKQRGLIGIVALATLLIPAVGTIAGPNARKEKAERRLEQIREQLDADQSQAQGLRKELGALDASLRKLHIEISRLDRAIAEIEGEVQDAQARINETQAQIDRVRQAAIQQAVALYKAGSIDILDTLLDSESLAELDSRVALLGVAAEEKTGALIKYGRLQVRIRGQQEDLFDRKDELASELKNRTKFKDELATQQERFSEKLAELRARIGINKSREKHKVSELAAIKQQILEAQAKNAVAALGTSNKGFIWPLNGNVTSYYGPRWGRMHTGIDIDGYTGQPIVAVKEGRVVLASYYSGYGNAVIVDHGGGYSTLYAHMSSFNTSNGASVEQGQVIGYVGCTGSCTGDHLHFEVRINGEPTDPMRYLP